jgi:hypothetical protein
MMKRQSVLNYPIKGKKIIKKERKLLATEESSDSENESPESPEDLFDKTEKDGDIEEENDSQETTSTSDVIKDLKEPVVAVTPVRITSHHKTSSDSENQESD